MDSHSIISGALVSGTLGGFVAAAATFFGAALYLAGRRWRFTSKARLSFDFALGMMFSAAAFSLILPAAREVPVANWSGLALAISGGAAFIGLLSRVLEGEPHSHSQAEATNSVSKQIIRSPRLFIIAMLLHNLPEGLASGVSLAGLGWTHALPVLTAIALQNIPEGLTTGMAFEALGAPQKKAFAGSMASGLVELVGGIVGGVLLHIVADVLPFALAFAGGAMLFVTLREIRERLHVPGISFHRVARDLATGAVFMLVLSTLG